MKPIPVTADHTALYLPPNLHHIICLDCSTVPTLSNTTAAYRPARLTCLRCARCHIHLRGLSYALLRPQKRLMAASEPVLLSWISLPPCRVKKRKRGGCGDGMNAWKSPLGRCLKKDTLWTSISSFCARPASVAHYFLSLYLGQRAGA